MEMYQARVEVRAVSWDQTKGECSGGIGGGEGDDSSEKVELRKRVRSKKIEAIGRKTLLTDCLRKYSRSKPSNSNPGPSNEHSPAHVEIVVKHLDEGSFIETMKLSTAEVKTLKGYSRLVTDRNKAAHESQDEFAS